jgi:hypothetical protein
MAKTKEVGAPAPCTPPPKKVPPTVASIKKEMKTMSVAAANPKFIRFNFNQQFMIIGTNTTYLKDGLCHVYFDYLVNLMVSKHFNMTMSTGSLFCEVASKSP